MLKLGRNDACWCGSGKKYKNCHLAFDRKIENYGIMGDLVPEHYRLRPRRRSRGSERPAR